MKKKVLVVDDEKDIRTSIQAILEKQGYEVKTAIDGDDCLKILKGYNPDLILMDIMMPGTSVKEVVKKIKGIKISYLSVVRITEAEKENLMSKNIIGFIQKPFDIEELANKVKYFLGAK